MITPAQQEAMATNAGAQVSTGCHRVGYALDKLAAHVDTHSDA